MARISSAFKCMVCEKKLEFPNNLQIVDFVILLLQFYKDHDICEQNLKAQEPTPAKLSGPSKKKKR